jgi:hypothetical protein
LPTPKPLEQVAQTMSEDGIAEHVACGPDPDIHTAEIDAYADAGFDRVYVYQVGHDPEPCIDFYEREVLPSFGEHLGSPHTTLACYCALFAPLIGARSRQTQRGFPRSARRRIRR